MKRDAKLYYLHYGNWRTIAAIIETNDNVQLMQGEITIFVAPGQVEPNEHFTILSISERIDAIVEAAGAKAAGANDINRDILPVSNLELAYGNKDNLKFLKKATG